MRYKVKDRAEKLEVVIVIESLCGANVEVREWVREADPVEQ